MTKIEIIPLKGIKIENVAEVLLGQSKNEIETILGKSNNDSSSNQLFYDDFEFRIDFDKSGNAEFIEFTAGPFPEKTKLSIYGINPFRIGSEKLIELLTLRNNGEIDDSEANHCFIFLNISVGVYRGLTEQEMRETIENMKLKDEYEKNKDLLVNDLERSKNFWTIGIGVKNYYY